MFLYCATRGDELSGFEFDFTDRNDILFSIISTISTNVKNELKGNNSLSLYSLGKILSAGKKLEKHANTYSMHSAHQSKKKDNHKKAKKKYSYLLEFFRRGYMII